MLAAKPPANTAVDTTATAQRTCGNDRDRHVCNRHGASRAMQARTTGGAASETTVKAGDACICPDGRKGTIHSFDEALSASRTQIRANKPAEAPATAVSTALWHKQILSYAL